MQYAVVGDWLLGMKKTCDPGWALPLARCVTLDKAFKLSDSISSSVKWVALKTKLNTCSVLNTMLGPLLGLK